MGKGTSQNFQPVIPVSLSKDWNLISRTIVPFISQKNVLPGVGDQGGVGDITQSFFFSPKAPGPGGVSFGASGRRCLYPVMPIRC